MSFTLVRVLSAQPMADGERVKISAAIHNDDWYLDAYGQNPSPFYRNPFLNPPARPPYPWKPAVRIWGPDDLLFPDGGSFGAFINTANSPASIDISGSIPVNAPPVGDAPLVPLQGTTSNTGGSIVPGTYYVAIASDGGPTSHFVTVVVPVGTSTNTVIVSGVVWTAAASGTVRAYIGADSQHMCRAASVTTASLDGFGNPTSFTITAFTQNNFGLHDVNFDSLLFQAKDIIHGGVWGAQITSTGVSGGDATATFAGATWTVNQWAGYLLTVYDADVQSTTSRGHLIATPGSRTFQVLSNTADTLKFVDAFGPGTGKVCVMRAAAAHITSGTIGDDNFVNFYGPSGLTVNGEIGNLVRIIAGTGAGQPPIPIASNTATVVTLSQNWYVTPDATSVWIIVAPQWRYSVSTGSLAGSVDSVVSVVTSIPLLSYTAGSLLIEGIAVDPDGNWSVERYAPFREIYVPAQSLTAAFDGEYLIPLVTVNRTLAAAITSTTAVACTLDATTGVPAAPFLVTFVSGECVRVTAITGVNVTAMDRGWNNTTAATQANGSAATIITATPDISQGRAQKIAAGGNITLMAAIKATGALAWTLDVVQDSTGGWSTYPNGTYVGIADNTAGDPRKWDNSASTRYFVNFAIGSDGNTRPVGGNGPYSLT